MSLILYLYCLQKHPHWIFLGYFGKIPSIQKVLDVYSYVAYKKYVTWLLNVEWFIGGCKWSRAMGENK